MQAESGRKHIPGRASVKPALRVDIL